jgi:hypothetical protein
LRRRKKLMLELCLGVLLWLVVRVQVSLEREISEFLFPVLEILQTLLLMMKMKRKMILMEVWVRGGKRRRLQREEGGIEDVGSR